MDKSTPYIGYIVGGSLKEGLHVRLTISPQEVQEGSFVVTESADWLFYGLVTDMLLGSTDPRFADEQSEMRLPPGLAKLLHGQTLYTNLDVLPVLMQLHIPEKEPEVTQFRDRHPDENEQKGPIPIKTIPAHHALVRLASAGDVAAIFGDPAEPRHFIIGHTREQGHPVCIDLDHFVQRSSGIFGTTGSGKSFLTRMILAGLIKYDKSSILVFDMHNEYGFDDTASDTNEPITGLYSKFTQKVRVVSLGPSATIRGRNASFNLMLAEKDIQPEDIEMLTRELDLRETTSTTLSALVKQFGRSGWFRAFKDMNNTESTEVENSVGAWAESTGVHSGAASALHSKLRKVFDRPYITENPPLDSLKQVVDLLAAGQHVILSFGNFETDLDYLLVTNILTRRIRDVWVELTNHYRSTKEHEPRPLVIVIEEAHKLLNREMASQTTFSTIAREMRKYYVTLLIVDQRPSQIYDEVMSQLGTRISASLGDESDIQAVLSGLAGRDTLRGMLARLQQKEEALLLGWGVPMPIPVRSRRYDIKFWEDLLGKEPPRMTSKQAIADIYGS
jgi:hypothetical protein